MPAHETVFTMEATPISFGAGASRDAGWALRRLGVTRAMVLCDPGVVAAGITARVVERIETEGIAVEVFDDVWIEPTLASLQRAGDAAAEGGFDGFVGLGGGSSLDTAKVADLVAPTPRRSSTTSTRPWAAVAGRPRRCARCWPSPPPRAPARRPPRSRWSTCPRNA